MSDKVEIFTDGSCLGNPGPGGYGALLRYKGREKPLSGGFFLTTNNRMELLAAIVALESLTRPCDVVLTTDSQYVRQGITQWIHNWKRRGWRKADKSPVVNVDLWQRSIRRLPVTRLTGSGSKVMPVIRKMSAVMILPARQLNPRHRKMPAISLQHNSAAALISGASDNPAASAAGLHPPHY